MQSGSAAWLGLEGRVCVVTGAASGIGAETARHLASVGAWVAILDRDEKGAHAVADEITGQGGRAIGIGADVTSPTAIAAGAARVLQELGACQVLVNNAAVLSTDPVMSLDLQQWNRVLGVNLTGAMICAQRFGAQMIEARRGGSIVNVASITGFYPMSPGGCYSVSKAGLMMLSRLLTVELAEHRIRSNVVALALVRTPFSEFVYRDPEVAKARERMIPAGRVSMPIDLANVIAFMASERSGYINGQEILVDGGLSQTLLGLIPKPKPNGH